MNVLNDDPPPPPSFTDVFKNKGNFGFRTSVFSSKLQSLHVFLLHVKFNVCFKFVGGNSWPMALINSAGPEGFSRSKTSVTPGNQVDV